MNWDDLKYLARLAETGSLSGAARRLKVEHATVARRIAALETAIGARLVDRRGGRYALTVAGRQAVTEALHMEEAALAVERIGMAAPAAAVEFGVTAPPAIMSELIVPRLPDFLAGNPDIRLRLIGESRNLSLTRREADIALRLTRPDIPTLTVRRAGRLDYGLFGSVGYAAARQEADFAFIGLDDDMTDVPQQIWLESIASSRPFVLRSNDLALQCAAAKAGMGIAALPLFVGAAHDLHRLWPERGTARDIWLAYHEDLRSSPRLATVAGFLASCLPN
jgi:molybdate transport repressor ModE-like protein